ncbi:MAG: radical SAM protein [Planctomycetota bacterium]
MTKVTDIITKAMIGLELTGEEIAELFEAPLFTLDAARIQNAARALSHRACSGLAEVHGQLGLNIAPCPKDCRFCAFAKCNGVFSKATEVPLNQVVQEALAFERDGANGIFLMGTADFPLERYLKVADKVRRALAPETVMVANVGDFDGKGAGRLKDAGFSGIYHAVRMGEGTVTKLDPQRRIETFAHAHNAGLHVGTCVEPVGPEHTTAELVEKTLITREARPVYSGSARRIPIPGTEMAGYGIVSEARMAHILAVVRLAVGVGVPGNCTHEPSIIGAAAGATLLWAEVGANPRDAQAETKGVRGMTVQQCRTVLQEAEWEVLDGPSKMYAERSPAEEGGVL